jgi:hypothetical protein
VTTADVLTTIKEYVWIGLPIVSLMIGLLNAYFGGGWGRKGIGWTFALTRAHQLAILRKRRARMIELHESAHAYVGALLSGVFWVLFLLAMQVLVECVFEALSINNPGWPPEAHTFARAVLIAERYCLSWAAGMIALARLQDYHIQQRYDRAIAGIDRAIANIEAKMPLQPAPSAG